MGQPRRENPWQVTGISDGRREQEASASPVIKDGHVSVEVETKGRAVSLNDSENGYKIFWEAHQGAVIQVPGV